MVSCIEGEPGPVRYAGSWAVGPALPLGRWVWLWAGFSHLRFCPLESSGPAAPGLLRTHGPPALARPRSILFSPDGCCLYSGCQDSLRVYGWEPERCFDVVPISWGKVADLAVCNNQLVRELPTLPSGHPAACSSPPGPHFHWALAGALPTCALAAAGQGPAPALAFLQIGVAFSQSNVSSYVVDLTRVTRTGTVAQDPVQDSRPLAHQPPLPSAPLRRIYERPSTTCSKPQRWAGARGAGGHWALGGPALPAGSLRGGLGCWGTRGGPIPHKTLGGQPGLTGPGCPTG